MDELEMVLNGIDEVEKCGLICEIDGTPCHHFPDSLISDIKNLLKKQNDIIERYHRVNFALTLFGTTNK